jgi:hypothetical protein
MADRQLLATTRSSAFQPLLSGGRPTTEAWDQLRGFLVQALGAVHAELLAEPRPNAAGSIDWFGPAGTVRPIDAAGRRRLKTLMTDIRHLADDLDRAGDESRRSLGRLLRQALCVPAGAQAYCVGEQPVLTAWGHAGVQPTRRRGTGLAAMVAVIVVLLLGAVAGWWLWRHLPVPALRAATDPAEIEAIATLHAAQDRTAVLRQRLDELRLQTAALRLQCPPPAPAVPKPPVSIFSPEVKPSMPATPKRPVEVTPLAPPARQ